MFEENNQPSQAPQNLPRQNDISEEEKKLFGEAEGKNFSPAQPAAMISKEFIDRRKKLPFFLILVIAIFLIAGGWAVYSFVLSPQNISENNQLTPLVNNNNNNNNNTYPKANYPIGGVAQNIDTDGDGLTDQEESQLGTNSKSTDSDQDGLFDYEEVKLYQTDPLNPDTDGDGFSDGTEVTAGYNPKDSAPGAKLLNILNQLETNQAVNQAGTK
jgi:hypothetical protein